MTDYDKQRKIRLQNAIDDYLQDDKVSPSTFYNDLRDCLEDIITYHQTSKNRAQDALELIMNNQSNSADTDKITTPKSYEYAAHITMEDIAKFQRGNSL